MKLILIDDDCLVVGALKMILESQPDFEIAATAELIFAIADTGK